MFRASIWCIQVYFQHYFDTRLLKGCSSVLRIQRKQKGPALIGVTLTWRLPRKRYCRTPQILKLVACSSPVLAAYICGELIRILLDHYLAQHIQTGEEQVYVDDVCCTGFRFSFVNRLQHNLKYLQLQLSYLQLTVSQKMKLAEEAVSLEQTCNSSV